MKKEQHISRKKMDGYTLYRIHDIINGKLQNLRAVKQTDEDFTVLLDLSIADREFVLQEGDIHLYCGSSESKVIDTLKEHENKTKENITEIMKCTGLVNIETIDVRTIAGHTYVITEEEIELGVPRINYVFGLEDGRISYYGSIPKEHNIEHLLLECIERPFKQEVNQMFQIGPNEYSCIRKLEEHQVYISVPLLLIEDESGQLAWSSDAEYFRFFKKDDENNVKLINKPENLFNKREETQKYLEEITKEATRRVLNA